MQKYQPRKVEFHQLLTFDDWRVKVYTITHRTSFASSNVLTNAIANLPKWLAEAIALQLPIHNIAFLVVHEGRDGVWTLINWWVDENMLQSMTFFTRTDQPDEFAPLPHGTFMACVWEMAVLSFERAMWIEHILKQADHPDFTGYCNQYLHKEV